MQMDTFYDADQLYCKFQYRPPFTEMLGLQKAIPFQWLDWLRKDVEGPPFKDWYKILNKSTNKVKTAFWNLNHNNDLLFDITNKWNICGPDEMNITSEELLKVIINMYKNHQSPKNEVFSL